VSLPEFRFESAPAARPRILLLTDVYFPRVNGVSTSIAVYRRELEALGVETLLVAPSYAEEESERGIVRVPGRRVPLDPEDRFLWPGRLVRAAGRRSFDLVHVQTPFAAHVAGVRLARARGVPLLETWHTDFEHYFEHYLPWVPAAAARALARALARRIGRQVDHLLVPSSAIDAALAGYGVATPRTVLPTGLAPGELGEGDGARFRAAHGIGPERRVAVHIGRLAREKNVGFLLEVADLVRREIPDFLQVIAGEGPARVELERRARELGLDRHVLFVGYLDRRRELADCYRAGECFVFASTTETQGLVLLEAMALGVPVVALAARGTTDLLAARRGALVPEAERGAFARDVVRLLGDPPLAARLAREGRQEAARWSAPDLARRLVAVYDGLVARRNAVTGSSPRQG
jgi:glycosyltransferase involved in cell wall biosynthesis